LCVAECPVEAIYADDDVPEDQQEFIEINERLSKVWPIITSRKDPLPEAEEFSTKTDKRALLIENEG
jgi:ferredoxin|tara:strand:+ start:264 stop:464 length:201 start_codon:yes stop_codon:yes gene_type:complete